MVGRDRVTPGNPVQEPGTPGVGVRGGGAVVRGRPFGGPGLGRGDDALRPVRRMLRLGTVLGGLPLLYGGTLLRGLCVLVSMEQAGGHGTPPSQTSKGYPSRSCTTPPDWGVCDMVWGSARG